MSEYKSKGYDLTLRQIYYQFVARDWLPEHWADKATGSTNNIRSYKNLGSLLSDARMAGVMDWDAIVDRTREMDGQPHWSSPANIIDQAAQQYRIDKWEGQIYRPEVWVEKDALEGIVKRSCRALDIMFFSCRGYTSMSSIHDNARRMKAAAASTGIKPVIIHLGDHDPSGIDMSRDIEERVRLFMAEHGDDLTFVRIALNMDQVERYNPPENPAKITDTRAKAYIEEHGESSWELDALDPDVISNLIEEHVAEYRDDELYSERESIENTERKLLAEVSLRWEDVRALVEKPKKNGGKKK